MILKLNFKTEFFYMYFIGNLQPKSLPDYEISNGFLNYEEKKKVIKRFEELKKKGIILPICDEHGGGDKPGFKLSNDKIIGKINEIIINDQGSLLVLGELYKNNKITNNVFNELYSNKKDYGISLWIDLLLNPNMKSENDLFLEKNLNHVAVTKNPGLGYYGAYIYEYGKSKEKIENVFRDKYYKFKEENLNNSERFASDELLNHWEKGIKLLIF
jgi:hypothetical protein